MKLKSSQKKTVEFIPEWNGNKELPQEEQIVVLFKNLKAKERTNQQTDFLSSLSPKEYSILMKSNKIKNQNKKKNKKDEDYDLPDELMESPEFLKKQLKNSDEIVEKYVVGIKNLEDEDGPIDTIQKLEDSVDPDAVSLYNEIHGAVVKFVNGTFLKTTS